MGCFWTFTPQVIESIGYFDEVEFRVRGHAHIDYSMRATRAGFNNSDTLFDARGSHSLIRLQSRVGYLQSFDWNTSSARALFSTEERARRKAIILDTSRVHVAFEPLRTDDPVVWVSNPWQRRLDGDFAQFPATSGIPEGLVLSLARTPERWISTASTLAGIGIRFERVLGVDGGLEPLLGEWRSYSKSGPQTAREKLLGRRLLASSGALGYLHSVKAAIARARERRLEAFILFDDDVFPHRQAAKLLENIFAELPRRWKLVHLGGRQSKWNDVRYVSDHLYRPAEPPFGSYALAIHSSAYDLLDKEIASFDSPFDDAPIQRIWSDHADEVFVAWPPIVLPDVSDSLIREARDISELAKGASWNVEEYQAEIGRPDKRSPKWTIVLALTSERVEDVRRALDGWRHQLEADFELIILACGEINIPIDRLRDHLIRDGRVSFLTPSNTTVDIHECLNLVVRQAKGKWVYIGGVSEWAAPDFLSKTSRDAELRGLQVMFPEHVDSGGALPARVEGERKQRIGSTLAGRALILSRQSCDVLGGVDREDINGGDGLLRRARAAGLRVAKVGASLLVGAGVQRIRFGVELGVTHNRTSGGSGASPLHRDVLRDSTGRSLIHLVPLPIDRE
jgi:hypothetical protein